MINAAILDRAIFTSEKQFRVYAFLFLCVVLFMGALYAVVMTLTIKYSVWYLVLLPLLYAATRSAGNDTAGLREIYSVKSDNDNMVFLDSLFRCVFHIFGGMLSVFVFFVLGVAGLVLCINFGVLAGIIGLIWGVCLCIGSLISELNVSEYKPFLGVIRPTCFFTSVVSGILSFICCISLGVFSGFYILFVLPPEGFKGETIFFQLRS